MIGNGGDDFLDGYEGNDVLDGGAGIDTASFNGNRAGFTLTQTVGGWTITDINAADGDMGTDTLANIEFLQFADTRESFPTGNNGTAGDDSLQGSEAADLLQGLDGNDFLNGGAGNDTLEGGNGNDDLRGQGGNDSLLGGSGGDRFSPGSGNDFIDGGSDWDGLEYSDATSAVTVNLGITTAQNTGSSGIDTILNIEYLDGSSFNDSLVGDGNNNALNGREGNDTLDGGAGIDTVGYWGSQGSVTVSLAISGPAGHRCVWHRCPQQFRKSEWR